MDHMSGQARPTTCNIANCSKLPVKRGLCNMHFANLVRHGHPLAGPQPRSGEPGEGLWVRIARKLKDGA